MSWNTVELVWDTSCFLFWHFKRRALLWNRWDGPQ